MAGTATAPKKVRKIGGKTFRLKSCKAAKTVVASLRKKGKTARVIAGCAYEGPKAKAPFGGKRRKKRTVRRKTR